MDLADAISDAWAARLDYYQGQAYNAAGTLFGEDTAQLRIPEGFPPGMSAQTWALAIQGAFAARVEALQETGDAIDANYAESTQEAMETWRLLGGPTQDSAFKQLCTALDAVVLDMAGLDATASLVQEIRTYLASANSGREVPFPRDPPFASRERLLASTSPRDFARYLAVSVVLLPYLSHLQGTVTPQSLYSSRTALEKAAIDASIVEAAASAILSGEAAQDTMAPTSWSNLRQVLDQSQEALKRLPGGWRLPPSILTTMSLIQRRLDALATGLDRVADAPAQAAEGAEDAEDLLKKVLTGLGLLVAAGIVITAARRT